MRHDDAHDPAGGMNLDVQRPAGLAALDRQVIAANGPEVASGE